MQSPGQPLQGGNHREHVEIPRFKVFFRNLSGKYRGVGVQGVTLNRNHFLKCEGSEFLNPKLLG